MLYINMERSHGGGLTMSDGESNKKAVASTALKKGPWTAEEDQKLVDYIGRNGHGSWRALPKEAGLNRCGKSCRLRWTNYLRPDIKRGNFSQDEEKLIIHLHSLVGNKWSTIAGHLPGRTDNEIKNLWNTHLKKKLLQMGIDPITHRPISTDHLFANYHNSTTNNNNTSMTFPPDKIHVLNNLLFQLLNYNLLLSSSSSSNNESIINNTTINHDYYSSLLEHYYSNCTTTSNNTHDNPPPPLFIPPSTSDYINTNNIIMTNNNDNTIDNNIPSSAYTSCNINNDHQLPPMSLHNNAHTTNNNKSIINNNNNNNNSSILSSFEASPLDDVDDSSYWNHIIMDLASSQTSMDNNIIQ